MDMLGIVQYDRIAYTFRIHKVVCSNVVGAEMPGVLYGDCVILYVFFAPRVFRQP